MEFCHKLEDAERAALNRTLTTSQARRLFNEVLQRVGDEPLDNFTVEGWLREWVATKKASRGQKTGERYAKPLQDFIAHLGPRANLPLRALTPRATYFRHGAFPRQRCRRTPAETLGPCQRGAKPPLHAPRIRCTACCHREAAAGEEAGMKETKKSASKFAAKLSEFPCPTWNVKTKKLDFPLGTPPGRERDSAEYWLPKIGDMLKPASPG